MDRERLKAIIREKYNNFYTIAEKMDINRVTFSKKINRTDGFDFTKCEKMTLTVLLGIPYKELWDEEFLVCKDCYHYKLCPMRNGKKCEHFKDKSQVIELPMKTTDRLKDELTKYCYERCIDEL